MQSIQMTIFNNRSEAVEINFENGAAIVAGANESGGLEIMEG